MNCELAHERIVMAAYGELPDDFAHELERHLTTCTACAREKDQVHALKLLADAYPVEDPDPNLIARSRLRLEEAMDTLPPTRWLERVLQKLRNNAAGLQTAPFAACLLLIIGAGAGSLAGYHISQARFAKMSEAALRPQVQQPGSENQGDPAQAAPLVAGISSIVRQPNSEMIEVRYNQLVPQQLTASLDSPEIRHLLVLASANAPNPDIRGDSVSLMAAECRAGHRCQAAGLRDALMFSLRYDRDADVRQKALEGLEPYVAQDFDVRDAVLDALLNDPDPRIRTDAITVLEPVQADTSVRQVLQSVANSDRNPQIRLVSRQVLRHVGEIQ